MQKIIHKFSKKKIGNPLKLPCVPKKVLKAGGLPGQKKKEMPKFYFIENVFNPVMKIFEISDNKVVWQCIEGHEPWQDDIISFQISEENDFTGLKFIQEYTIRIDEDSYGEYNYNWAYYPQSLKKHCEEGTGTPFNP